jgi:hypothetical protein
MWYGIVIEAHKLKSNFCYFNQKILRVHELEARRRRFFKNFVENILELMTWCLSKLTLEGPHSKI